MKFPRMNNYENLSPNTQMQRRANLQMGCPKRTSKGVPTLSRQNGRTTSQKINAAGRERTAEETNMIPETEIIQISQRLAAIGFDLDAPALIDSKERQKQGYERRALLTAYMAANVNGHRDAKSDAFFWNCEVAHIQPYGRY